MVNPVRCNPLATCSAYPERHSTPNSGAKVAGRYARHRLTVRQLREIDQIRSVADTTLVVWIEAVEGLISDRVAPRRFAYASVAVDSRTVG